MARILIVDDEQSLRLTVGMMLKRRGHEVVEAASGSEAIARLKQDGPDIVITDLRMGEVSGEDVLRATKQHDSSTEVIVLTAHGTVESAVAAMKNGAFDYVEKPFDLQALALKVDKALERRQLVREMHQLRQAFDDRYSFDRIIAKSQGMQQVLARVARIANTDATVLVEGETGTGKDLVARAIHNNSARHGRQFVAINCGALPEQLLESELFGHVKGAFTSAVSDKAGLFEEADGGTIFLDEISELLPVTQVKLLRVLQDGESRRVGSNRPLQVDVRVIAATNRRLWEVVREGAFREDLFYRLNVIQVRIPPLRERRDDILPLAWHFLKQYAAEHSRDVQGFSPPAQALLLRADWPGNVRELENTIERAVVLAAGDTIEPSDLSTGPEGDDAPREDGPARLDEVVRRHILRTLELVGGNRAKAAELLGIGRNTLWRKLKEYEQPAQTEG